MDRETETLAHAWAGAQVLAAPSVWSVSMVSEGEREALNRVQVLAEAIGEELMIWDLATHRGRQEARRRGIRATPRVIYRSGTPETVEAFQARAGALLRGTRVPAS